MQKLRVVFVIQNFERGISVNNDLLILDRLGYKI